MLQTTPHLQDATGYFKKKKFLKYRRLDRLTAECSYIAVGRITNKKPCENVIYEILSLSSESCFWLVTTMTSVIVWCSTGSRPTPPGNSVVAARSAHLFDGAVACGPSNPRRQSCCRRVGGQVRRHGLVIVRRHRLKRLRENLSLTIMLSITCLFRRRRRRLRSIAGNLIRAIDGDVTERSTAQFPPPFSVHWRYRIGRRKLDACSRSYGRMIIAMQRVWHVRHCNEFSDSLACSRTRRQSVH